MKKTQKTKLIALFTVLLTLFTALFIPINAAEPETPEDMGIEEIMPKRSFGCLEPWIEVEYFNGEPYSVTFYDSYGREETRIDYQGKPHFIDGEYRLPHQHNFTYHIGPEGQINRTDAPTYKNFREWQ